jgi:hypothetical protein
MIKICRTSGQPFEITEDDLRFYEKMGVPPPTLCPEERMRRRLAWRNERKLYHRVCDGSGKKIISMYSPDKPFPVYENDYWWSDNLSGQQYKRDYDFRRSLFEQFKELLDVTPKMARIQQGENENSTYCNTASWNKNCYLLQAADQSEDCFYGNWIYRCANCTDCSYVMDSELCYEVLHHDSCYNCRFCQNCDNSSDLWFCKDCVGCNNCFGCVNLRNKQYYFNNTPCTKEEYKTKLESLGLQKHSRLQYIRNRFYQYVKTHPQKYSIGIENENGSGCYNLYTKNALICFDCENIEDCKFCDSLHGVKSAYDVSYYGASEANELLYECEGVGHGVFNVKFSKLIWGGCANIEYCYECFKCTDCFACIGLKNAQYCILNKQYSKEEYFALREKIIEHMNNTGEWGEFFPIELSPFAYNETVAQEYFPLTKETVGAYCNTPLQKAWKDDEPGAKYDGPKVEIPETIAETPDDICNQILTCETCSKNYRIVKPELAFYRKMNLPVPHNCPDCRHKARMALRNPRKLWEEKL